MSVVIVLLLVVADAAAVLAASRLGRVETYTISMRDLPNVAAELPLAPVAENLVMAPPAPLLLSPRVAA